MAEVADEIENPEAVAENADEVENPETVEEDADEVDRMASGHADRVHCDAAVEGSEPMLKGVMGCPLIESCRYHQI